MGNVDVSGVGLIASGHADPLELPLCLEEGRSIERVRNEDLCGRKRDGAALRVHDEERHAYVARLVVRRAGDDRHVVTGRSPELLERGAPAGLGSGCRCVVGSAAPRREQQARQHGQCRSRAHTRPSVAARFLASVRPGMVLAPTALTEPRRNQGEVDEQQIQPRLHCHLLSRSGFPGAPQRRSGRDVRLHVRHRDA
jgi:hypothetical protein